MKCITWCCIYTCSSTVKYQALWFYGNDGNTTGSGPQRLLLGTSCPLVSIILDFAFAVFWVTSILNLVFLFHFVLLINNYLLCSVQKHKPNCNPAKQWFHFWFDLVVFFLCYAILLIANISNCICFVLLNLLSALVVIVSAISRHFVVWFFCCFLDLFPINACVW